MTGDLEGATAAATATAPDLIAAAAQGSQAPYPGLRVFRPAESDIFFGREQQVDELLRRLAGQRFLAIVGVSGCGKSSLVGAGMIPGLETGLLASAGVHWVIAPMRPGDRPLRELARQLAKILPEAEQWDSELAPSVEASLRRGPLGLRDVLIEHQFDPQQNLLLVVDQFEEIFRYRRDGNANEADAFVALLLASARITEFPVYVVLAMRSDYLGECAVFNGLPEQLNDGQFLTPRLTREQRRDAIEGPAAVFEARVDPTLSNRLLNDMGADPDQLPLMQHLLMRMWEHAQSGPARPVVLTLSDYEAVGGFANALQQHVEEVFGRLDASGQRIAEILFRACTERVENKQDSRRPVRLGDVADLAGVEWTQVAEVVEVFRSAGTNFLLPPEGRVLEPDSIVDLSHESLIRQWPRLTEWVRDEGLRAERYRGLEADACEWQARRHARSWLLRTGELDEALAWHGNVKPTALWARRYGGNFALVKDYLRRSVSARRWRRVLTGGGLLAALAVAGVVAEDRRLAHVKAQRQQEQIQLDRDRMGRAYDLALQSGAVRNMQLGFLGTSTLLAIEAVKQLPSVQSSQALQENLRLLPPRPRVVPRTTTRDHERRATSAHLAFDAEGTSLLAADGTWIRRIAMPDGEDRPVACPACADGDLLAIDAAGRYGVLKAGTMLEVVDLEDGKRRGRPIAAPDVRKGLAVSSEGRTVAVWSGDTIGVYSVDGGRRLARVTVPQDAQGLVLDPQARTAVIWEPSGGHVTVKDLRSGKTAFSWNVGSLTLTSLAFSPNGRFIAAISVERVVRVWDVRGFYEVARFNMTAYPSPIADVIVADSGDHLALLHDDAIRIFDIGSKLPREIARIEGLDAPRAMRFAPDASQFAALTRAGLHVWQLDSGDGTLRFTLGVAVNVVAISPDKRLVAAAGSDAARGDAEAESRVAVWDVASGEPVATAAVQGTVGALRFVGARTLAYGDGTGRLHRLRLPTAPASADVLAAVDGPDVRNLMDELDVRTFDCGRGSQVVAISGDGQRIVVTSTSPAWCLYDGSGTRLAHGELAAELVGLSDRGDRVVGAGIGRQLHLLDAAHPTTPSRGGSTSNGAGVLATASAPVLGVALNADGRYVGFSTWRRGARILMPDRSKSRGIQVAASGQINALAFSGAQDLLVTGGEDANVRLWEILPDRDSVRELSRLPQQGPVTAVALSADDELVLSASGAAVKLQPWRHLDLVDNACARVGRDLTHAEWNEFIPDQPYEETCGLGLPAAGGEALHQADAALVAGDIDNAIEQYRRADVDRPLSPYDWNDLCWHGALWGYAQDVLFACEKAVKLLPDDEAVRDSRGMAYALVGRRAEAAADLRFVLGQSSPAFSEEERSQRRRWLGALERKETPLSLKELRTLRGS